MPGTVVITQEEKILLDGNREIRVLKYVCTADAAAASYPSTDTSTAQTAWIQGFSAYLGITDPGATAPTANYDIALNDEYGADVFGAELNNRSATVTEQAMPKMGNHYGPRPVTGTLSLVITNNSVNSALVTIYIYFRNW